jgi:hypothetical protein
LNPLANIQDLMLLLLQPLQLSSGINSFVLRAEGLEMSTSTFKKERAEEKVHDNIMLQSWKMQATSSLALHVCLPFCLELQPS